MKRIMLSLMFLVAVFSVKADQLAYITKSQADKAVIYLKSLEYVIEYCGCCDGSYEEYLYYTDVYAKHTGYEDYYEVILLVDNYDGTTREHPVDLAYIHIIKDDGFAYCLGLELGFQCDPCTEPFLVVYDEGYEEEYFFMAKPEAEAVRALLLNQKYVYYYCACCESSELIVYTLTITSIEVHEYEDFELVELVIVSVDQNGEIFYVTAADLFAIFIPETSTYAYSLSRKLELVDFDSCVDGITLK